MKISKLFHWLYGILMLLPVFYILFRCAYCVFNQNATASTPLIDMFVDSVNAINTESLFSWATTSFLVSPFSYIADLFGMSSTNPIITMLSYWLSISIIYLVFDLIMYIPLLVHRWLDKGIIE